MSYMAHDCLDAVLTSYRHVSHDNRVRHIYSEARMADCMKDYHHLKELRRQDESTPHPQVESFQSTYTVGVLLHPALIGHTIIDERPA